MFRSRVINAVGFVMTGSVLVIVLGTKFTHGAWIVCIAMPLLYLLMQSIHKHYEQVKIELAAEESESVTLPSRVHAIVLVSKVHKPTLRAVAFARATRPSTLEAITVDVEEGDTEALAAEWERRQIPVPLKVLDSPYREVTRPILDYVRNLHRSSPRDLVIVYVPEYVVGRWWEQILHNQSALRLKARLLFVPGVMVCAVPWQLASSALVAERPRASRWEPSARASPRPRCRTPSSRRSTPRATTPPPLRDGRRRQHRAGRPRSAPAAPRGRARRPRRPLRGPARRPGRLRAARAARARRVDAVVTGHGAKGRFLRADAVEVLVASPDRVDAPCAHARPGGCGGCDWQHASRDAQLALKGDVLREQLHRLGGLDEVDGVPLAESVGVAAVPGDQDGLGWRTRVRYAVDLGRTPRVPPAPLARRRGGRAVPAGHRGRRRRGGHADSPGPVPRRSRPSRAPGASGRCWSSRPPRRAPPGSSATSRCAGCAAAPGCARSRAAASGGCALGLLAGAPGRRRHPRRGGARGARPAAGGAPARPLLRRRPVRRVPRRRPRPRGPGRRRRVLRRRLHGRPPQPARPAAGPHPPGRRRGLARQRCGRHRRPRGARPAAQRRRVRPCSTTCSTSRRGRSPTSPATRPRWAATSASCALPGGASRRSAASTCSR